MKRHTYFAPGVKRPFQCVWRDQTDAKIVRVANMYQDLQGRRWYGRHASRRLAKKAADLSFIQPLYRIVVKLK